MAMQVPFKKGPCTKLYKTLLQ